jgi:uncharacterized protein (DUF488 family)
MMKSPMIRDIPIVRPVRINKYFTVSIEGSLKNDDLLQLLIPKKMIQKTKKKDLRMQKFVSLIFQPK